MAIVQVQKKAGGTLNGVTIVLDSTPTTILYPYKIFIEQIRKPRNLIVEAIK